MTFDDTISMSIRAAEMLGGVCVSAAAAGNTGGQQQPADEQLQLSNLETQTKMNQVKCFVHSLHTRNLTEGFQREEPSFYRYHDKYK